jgi:hypothetical protein
MVAIIIMLSVFGLVFAGLGIFIIKFIARKILEWWGLRQDAVIVEGVISTRSYLPPSRNHGTIYNVTYSYDYQGKTYSKQESVSKEFYSILGPPVPLRKGVPKTTPVAEEKLASVKCVSHHPAISKIVDPTKVAGTEKSDVAATIMHILISVFGLFLFGLGMFSLLTALQQLLLLLSKR